MSRSCASNNSASAITTTSCCGPLLHSKAKDLKPFANLFKALSDETRLEILGLLAVAEGELCVCEIEASVKHLSQPTISHHLRQLRSAGLVTSERRATWVYYRLEDSLRDQLREFLHILSR